TIEMDGQVRQTQQRPLQVNQPGADTLVPILHHDAAGRGHVAASEGCDVGVTVDLNPQAIEAGLTEGATSLDTKPGRVGMGADDAHRRISLPQAEGNDGAAIAHYVTTGTRGNLPVFRFFVAAEPGLLQPLRN